MKRPPRNAATDHLVTGKLMCLAYLQIGIMQALAGFYAWMLVLNDYGFPPVVLIGNPGATAPTGKLGFFADQVMYCKYNGGQYVNAQGQVDPEGRNPSEVGPRRQYPLWDRGDGGPPPTIESIYALHSQKYFEYVPWRGRMSEFR